MANRQVYFFWDYFRRLGIADDLTIIGHLARLLAEQQDLTPPAELEYDPLPANLSQDIDTIQRSITRMSASPGVDSAARLFDPFFLFELAETLPGERYPTPRHITRFMLTIADVRPEHDLADFACGSGGMLAWREAPPTGRTVGYEISPTWARLAWTNCALCGFTQLKILPRNALDIAPEELPEPFDRVVMNPPFGTVPVRVGEATSRSETAFIETALALLKDQGRLCVLVPAGSLFGGGKELGLRQTLVDNYQLDAVVALPKDAFQPFSHTQAYVLLLTKQAAPADHATWFFRTIRDGYPAGRSRDLTANPTQDSDLPLAEALLTSTATEEQGDGAVRWRRYIADGQAADEEALYTIESLVGATTITHIDRLELRTKEDPPRNVSFLEVHTRFEMTTDSHVIDISSRAIKPTAEPREDWIKGQTGLDKLGDAKPVPIYTGQGNAQAVAFTREWRVLAVRVARESLRTAQNYQLQPERYVTAEDDQGLLRPPGTLLAEIRSNQRQLAARVDGMLGRIEAPPISDGALLVPLWDATELEPILALLSEEQRELLAAVRQQTWSNADATLIVPKHFVATDLSPLLPMLPSAIIEQTLDLLERMGMIVRVTIPVEDEEKKRVNAYRLTHQRDHWQVAEPVEQE